jgi:hypothetical protein
MRLVALTLALFTGCTADDGTDVDGPTIAFLRPGTLDPLTEGTDCRVYLRMQGDFGTEVDIRIVGVELEALANFAIAIESDEGDELARQLFLPTSTAQERDDGSITIAELPVVFHEDVAPAEVEDAPATMRAQMETTPPTTGELRVVLQRMD